MMATLALGAAIIAVAIAVVAIAMLLPLRGRLEALGSDLARVKGELRRMERMIEIGTAADASPPVAGRQPLRAAQPAAPPPPPPARPSREPRAWRPPAADAMTMPASPSPPAAVAPPPVPKRRSSRVADRTLAVRDRVARYGELVAQRAKPRQLQEVIEEDGSARAIASDASGSTLSLAAFDPNDPSQLLVALAGPEEGSFVVLPTFEYLENFRVAFAEPVHNPAVVRHLFDLEQDDAGGLRLIDPAWIRVDEAGVPYKDRTGRMGGYASGA